MLLLLKVYIIRLVGMKIGTQTYKQPRLFYSPGRGCAGLCAVGGI